MYSTNSLNILVYGDDSRTGLTLPEQYMLRTGHDQTDNTDTIMVVHISPGLHRVTVMSIPRDTMVPMYECDSGPGYAGQQADPDADVQINSLLQIGGPTCLWKTVEQATGIRIDHFIGIGMPGFVKVVNDLGGVNVCVPFNVNGTGSGLDLKAGEQHINGVQALAFWRAREDIGTGSDLERIQRDQFMSAQVVKGVLGGGLLSNPIRLVSVITDAAASMTTNAGMTVSDLVQIGESFPQPVERGRPVHHRAERAVDTEPQPGPVPAAAGRPGVRGYRPGHDRAEGLRRSARGTFLGRRPGAHRQPVGDAADVRHPCRPQASGASPSASASACSIAGLAQSNGGITAAAACTADSSAFAGPLSP